LIWLILIPLIVWNIRPLLGFVMDITKFWVKFLLIFGMIMVAISAILLSLGVIK
jgi:hypothetical protein